MTIYLFKSKGFFFLKKKTTNRTCAGISTKELNTSRYTPKKKKKKKKTVVMFWLIVSTKTDIVFDTMLLTRVQRDYNLCSQLFFFFLLALHA
jgi:hypothetical protein